MSTLKEIMASNIARLIKERGITQAGLARELNLETLTIHHYTTGHRFPKPENIDAICAYFKISYSDLVRHEEAPVPINAPVSKTLLKMMAIPDDVYDMAGKFGSDHKVWESVKVILKNAEKEMERKMSGQKKES